MALASAPTVNSEILRKHNDLSAQLAAYHYELSANREAVNLSVTDGTDSLSATAGWAFGLGHKGTYGRHGYCSDDHGPSHQSKGVTVSFSID
jgi:hypothetical protein